MHTQISVFFTVSIVITGAEAQVPTQAQLQTVDTELNQAYQQLKGTLNDAQKQELKIAQRDWLKKRDAFVAVNPGNPQGALYQATVQRVQELRNAISSTGKSNAAQNTASSTGPTSQQVQAADAELNQVYQQLKETLNDAQKQELKSAQKDWLKKRDAFVAANPENPQAALYQATMQRVVELRGGMAKSAPQQQAIVQQPTQQATPNQKQYGVPYQIPGGATLIDTISDYDLKFADDEFNQVYQQLLDSISDREKAILKEEQRDWIKKRDGIISRNQNQKAALLYLTRERTHELEKQIPDSYKATIKQLYERAIKQLQITSEEYLNSLKENESQIFLAVEGEAYKAEMNLNRPTHVEIDKVIQDTDALRKRLNEQNGFNTITNEFEVALQQTHRASSDDLNPIINGVYLKQSDVVVTSSRQEIKVWQARTGKLLRTIPVGSWVDWIFPSMDENNVIALSIFRRWSGGELRKVDVRTGKISDVLEAMPFGN